MTARSYSQSVSPAGLLVALGIIYGDIGTSPLYVLKAVAGTEPISEELVLGALSCIFWTLTILTTVKYVLLTLRADNRGDPESHHRDQAVKFHRGGVALHEVIDRVSQDQNRNDPEDPDHELFEGGEFANAGSVKISKHKKFSPPPGIGTPIRGCCLDW